RERQRERCFVGDGRDVVLPRADGGRARGVRLGRHGHGQPGLRFRAGRLLAPDGEGGGSSGAGVRRGVQEIGLSRRRRGRRRRRRRGGRRERCRPEPYHPRDEVLSQRISAAVRGERSSPC
ncbi:unnamed protein product, partial [Scytosiphon promiscuus]